MKLKNLVACLSICVGALLPVSGPVWAETFDINQLIDLSALTPEEVYRFEPDYLWVEPGDSIRFLNSTGNHTVTAIEGMWPDGAEFVNIEHQPLAEVVFGKPGIYGFKCKVHGRHGMYALIVVGSPEPNMDTLEYTNMGALGQRIFDGLLEQMKEDMIRRTEQ